MLFYIVVNLTNPSDKVNGFSPWLVTDFEIEKNDGISNVDLNTFVDEIFIFMYLILNYVLIFLTEYLIAWLFQRHKLNRLKSKK